MDGLERSALTLSPLREDEYGNQKKRSENSFGLSRRDLRLDDLSADDLLENLRDLHGAVFLLVVLQNGSEDAR